MRILPSEKLVAYLVVASAGCFLGLAVHAIAVVLLVVPFAVALVAGLAAARRPVVRVSAELSTERALEGDEAALSVAVVADAPLGRVDLAAHVPGALLGGRAPTASVLVERAGPHHAEVPLRAGRWGSYPIGPIAWRVHDPGRLLRYEGAAALDVVLRVHPRPELLRRLLEPGRTAPFPGSHTARRGGEGIEFAEVRPFVAGDRLAAVNARVSARRGELHVTLRHPEQHANVVVVVDTTSEATLEATVRAAVALVGAYGADHDRVGIVAFGSMVRWVAPGLGSRHLYRVLDALLASETPFSYVWRDLRSVPAPMLPPNALVWVVSPLEDDRPAGVVYRLARRGIDVSVLEVALEATAAPGPSPADALAHRLWCLRRGARRDALAAIGAPVVAWQADRPVALALEEAAAFRDRRRSRAR